MRHEFFGLVLVTFIIVWVNFGYLAIADQPDLVAALCNHVIS